MTDAALSCAEARGEVPQGGREGGRESGMQRELVRAKLLDGEFCRGMHGQAKQDTEEGKIKTLKTKKGRHWKLIHTRYHAETGANRHLVTFDGRNDDSTYIYP